ncbi:MAG TPA: carbohydrate ABC transporter permease [Chthonomonadaceae bacterium]|nr:carbohydrate ABC transporter permease [Chthonomonadaceae bacterium]
MRSSGPLGLTPAQRVLAYLALIALSILPLLPLVWMVSSSLKTDAQIFPAEGQSAGPLTLAQLIPHPFRWSNYPQALTTIPILTYLKNTLFLCMVTVLGTVFSSATVAYGFARLQFKGKQPLFMLMIATMVLPGQVTMIPVFALFRWLGWYGTYLPLTVPSFFGSAFYIFLLTQFYRTLPEDLSEAARVDGASEWRIFWQIILPLSKPALATCALFQFLGTWNDFFGPLLYMNDSSRYTLAYGLQQFLSAHGSEWANLMAAATLFTLPVIVLFFFAQRTFIQGIATTGGKN